MLADLFLPDESRSFRKIYPNYSVHLLKNYRESVEIKSMLAKASAVLEGDLPVRLPESCIINILNHLEREDWKIMVEEHEV